jgi:hypothetical protein
MEQSIAQISIERSRISLQRALRVGNTKELLQEVLQLYLKSGYTIPSREGWL